MLRFLDQHRNIFIDFNLKYKGYTKSDVRAKQTYLQEGQYLLREVVVEVRILGVGHVVDEHDAGFLGEGVLQGTVELVHHPLEGGLVRAVRWDVLVSGEHSYGGVC